VIIKDVLAEQIHGLEAVGRRAIEDYWSVYEQHAEQLTAELREALRTSTALGPILAAMSPDKIAEQNRASRARIKAALFEGEWDAYIAELRVQGAGYAEMGVSFAEWFRVVSVFRTAMRPRLSAAYGEDPQRLLRALGIMNRFIDIAMMVMGDEYIEAKQRIIVIQQEANRASEAKTEFLSRMSHELRTPLNAILGFAQLLDMDEHITSQQRGNIEHILKAGDHLLRLVDEVLDIARIESGRMTVSLEPVAVGEVVQEAIDLVLSLAARRGVAISPVACPDDLIAIADRHRLKQVILNLLSNGVKFNHSGGTVSVECSPVSDEVRIAVTDTGPGIERNDLDRLFLPFERLAAEPGVEGTGLGLALSKRLVELMGGSIGVDSAAGAGSTFWLRLPVATEAPRPVPHTPAAPVEAEVAGRTILYVEDNLANLKLIETVLARRNVKMVASMQGGIGVELAREHRPDLILLDLHLPDLSGIEVLAQLRSHPATREIPVIVISADATPGQLTRLKNAGASDYVTKPIDVRRFLQLVDEMLG
jgi:signal transduction histidine kinase